VQELAFALADAIGVLDRVRARGRVDGAAFARCVGRVSFFVNAGVRFVEEMCKVRALAALPRRPKLLVGKPGLDGHSNGAEAIAVAARDAGFEVVYAGIRLEPAAIAQAAVQEDVDVVGLSVLSGSHVELTAAVLRELAARGAAELPVVVGGIVPARDHDALARLGVRRVFTPRDYKLVEVVGALVDLCPS